MIVCTFFDPWYNLTSPHDNHLTATSYNLLCFNFCNLSLKLVVLFMFQGGMGDAEYIAAFQNIVMPVAYEV